MVRCPRCFQEIADAVYTWICQSGRCAPTVDPVASMFTNSDVASGPVVELQRPSGARRGWEPPPGATCPGCSDELADACPACHYPLPTGWRQAESTCIAMAGARATGKSLFIAVLIKQLEQLAGQLGTSIDPATPATQASYQTVYEKPLYEERGLMLPTPAAGQPSSYQREPLIFSLGTWASNRHYLVLRDVAGEDLERVEHGRLQYLEFFAHADAVFFMFDPLRVQEIRDQLQDLVPSQGELGGDPKTVLSKLLMVLGARSPKVAMILSKFDAVQALRGVDGSEWSHIMSNPGAAFSRDPSMTTTRYDDEDGRLLHHEVRSLLEKLHAGPIVKAIENAGNGTQIQHRFFAVSALGESPVGEKLHTRGIAPFRCVDPLRWVLSQKDVLESR
ncbi:TRAFAC clade GTPase domain-containing protein [Rhodococcus sp. TAF43]|uniref:TRAFAC clade GTPase domain-containing protein n=1 Tax=Rhodococcus sp. TAF43 TaxID=3237483 RepID=UPI003F979E21